MNRQIHQVTILVLVMFLTLCTSVTSVQGLARPALWEASSSQGTLTTDSRNSRTVYAEFGMDRGQIIGRLGGNLAAAAPAAARHRGRFRYSFPLPISCIWC